MILDRFQVSTAAGWLSASSASGAAPAPPMPPRPAATNAATKAASNVVSGGIFYLQGQAHATAHARLYLAGGKPSLEQFLFS
jgi:hypothetical protein